MIVVRIAVPVPPPSSGVAYDGTGRAFIHALTYAQTELLPMLLRIWPMPDDLPHAAGKEMLCRTHRSSLAL